MGEKKIITDGAESSTRKCQGEAFQIIKSVLLVIPSIKTDKSENY